MVMMKLRQRKHKTYPLPSVLALKVKDQGQISFIRLTEQTSYIAVWNCIEIIASNISGFRQFLSQKY